MTLAGRRPTWVEVDLDAIASNFHALRSRIGAGRSILAVVKADAYGHGAVPVALRLAEEGADFFGVALLEEGVELRRAGVSQPILVLGALTAELIPPMAEAGLTPVVYSMGTLSALLEAQRRLGRTIAFHLKVDTGMGRIGLAPRELGAALDRIAAQAALSLQGVLTTLAGSDRENNPRTRDQIRLFASALEEIRRRGLHPPFVHIANSGGVLNYPDAWFTMVRPGLALYGLHPSGTHFPDLRPALSFRTRAMQVKSVPPGSEIGYGGAFKAQRESRIATIAAGYDDGVNRLLHEKGEVIVRGRRAPYAGRISMDWAMVDVTDVPGVAEGDEVTILGEEGGASITAWDLARLCGTIPYEILCRIGPRVPRIYSGKGSPRPLRSRFD